MKRGMALIVLVAGAACDTPSSPSPTVQIGWVSGRVTSQADGAPIVAAAVSSPQSVNTTATDADGRFMLTGDFVKWRLDVDAPGFLRRSIDLPLVPLANLPVNAIRLAPPFSLDYYRQAVRGTRDYPDELFPLMRWVVAPRFFFLTRTLDAGDEVPAPVIDAMADFSRTVIPQLTGGRLYAAEVSRGTTRPSPETGWIIVESYSGLIPDAPLAGGDSFVGRNPGRIRLRLLPQPSTATCRFRMAGAFFHEIVHALGFWHVDGGFSVNNDCGALMPDLVYHAAIAYSRSPGNLDPDHDVILPPFTSTPMSIR